VVQNKEEVPRKEDLKKVSVSSLKPGQEVVGEINKLAPYGALVDVGANRDGLLHIQKVADLYGSYIDKEKGLVKAGLERGARIRVQVESNEKKRLFLDFTPAVKEEAEKDRIERQEQKQEEMRKYQEKVEAIEGRTTQAASATDAASAGAAAVATTENQASRKEEAPQAAYVADYKDNAAEEEEDYDDEDYDEYDEDRDIEDALGLGTY
jgi:predicted RNA-binding protein with RPS1 domain